MENEKQHEAAQKEAARDAVKVSKKASGLVERVV